MADSLSSIEDTVKDMDEVINTETDEDFLYVSTSENCEASDFRPKLAKHLHDTAEFTPTLEMRVKEDSDGLIAIIGDDIEHPLQVVTLYAGILELSDRETYQSLTKTSDLSDELFEGENPKEFAAGVINVVSTSITEEPIELEELNRQLDLDARSLQKETKRIVKYVTD